MTRQTCERKSEKVGNPLWIRSGSRVFISVTDAEAEVEVEVEEPTGD